MPLKYCSGEQIMLGDCVLYGQDSGVVEFVADPALNDPEYAWYIEEFGNGVMISQLRSMGSVFVSDPETDNDLQFTARVLLPSRLWLDQLVAGIQF